MKINKPNLNTESIEDLVTDAQSGELPTATDPAELEAPTEVILNPIEADQAIEISNNNPKTEDLDGLTAYEQVNKIASDIDENILSEQDVSEISNRIAALGENQPMEKLLNYSAEALKIAYHKLGIKPLSISREDIDNNPTEALAVIDSEVQMLQDKANTDTWATIKEDCGNIVKLIDAAIDTIQAKESDKDRALEILDKGTLKNNTVDLSSVIEYVGSLRYFLPEDKEGNLYNFTALLTDILDIDSPKLTSTDNTILGAINKSNDGSTGTARVHILEAISTDPLNVKLKQIVAEQPNLPDYALYGKITGLNKIKVLFNNDCKDVEVPSTYITFATSGDANQEKLFRESVSSSLKNFSKRFLNTFSIYKKKYETLESILKPLAYDLVSEQDQTKREEMAEVLKLVKYYYIGFVKNRIVDKLNAYQALITIPILTLEEKGE